MDLDDLKSTFRLPFYMECNGLIWFTEDDDDIIDISFVKAVLDFNVFHMQLIFFNEEKKQNKYFPQFNITWESNILALHRL